MKKCCCIILAAYFALAFVTTTLASDVVMEFYLSDEDAVVKPVKSIHCMLLDSDRNRILDEHFNDETVCKPALTLEEGDYSLIVEEPGSHYFGSMSVHISSVSSTPMLFLLDNLGLKPFEGVHSCEHNLACIEGDECVCDESCVCRRIHNKASLKFVGQTKECPGSVGAQQPSQSNVIRQRPCGQPTYSSSYARSNLYGTKGFSNSANGYSNLYGSRGFSNYAGFPSSPGFPGYAGLPGYPGSYFSAYGGGSAALGLMGGILGMVALVTKSSKSDPGSITEEPVYK